MNYTEESNKKESPGSLEIEANEIPSIDDFIKQLEAREKALDISSETIEIEDAGFEIDADVVDRRAPAEAKDELRELEEMLAKHDTPKPKKVSQPDETAKKFGTVRLENEIARLKEQVASLEGEKAEMVKSMRRRHSDFENFKNRIERERNETFISQLSNLSKHMLPVLDNLNRALDTVKNFQVEKSADFQQFVDGIGLVNQQLFDVLAEMGVHPIPAVGEQFDPHFHEAVATERADNVPHNTVIAELLRGYKIGDRVIRPSMVKVSSLPAAAAPAATPPAKAMDASPVDQKESGKSLLDID